MAAAIQVSLAGRFLHKLPPSWRYTTLTKSENGKKKKKKKRKSGELRAATYIGNRV
jgi:hypothetical protein